MSSLQKTQAVSFSFLFGVLTVVAALAARLGVDTPNQVDFNRDVRPLLSDTCFACHGPDDKQRQANLRLDTREGLFADRGSYRIISPGDLASSRLYQRISAAEPAMRMPPPWSDRQLTQEQIELIRRWIEQGAKWEQHWAFVPPQRPALPEVQNQSWPKNPLDYFVLSRLEREGLPPSLEADKLTLIRRVTLDLTGLPPTPAEVDAFLADRSPKAYEKVVDRLLDSPRYGERMAMRWLDLARYADTHGYHIDSHRDMWIWRDWVIDAFNRNIPFDQFTIEQLAGDLLPNARLEQKIATGFNRNHMINFEGGAIPEEYRNEYVVDRVNTTATVWMGLTMGCARCHDHKYDPLAQREFYEFYAFFNNIPEKGLDGREGNAEPVLPVPSPEQKRQLENLESKIKTLEQVLPNQEELAKLLADWEKPALSVLPVDSRRELLAHYELDGHTADTSGHYRHADTKRGEITYEEGPVGSAAKFDGDSFVSLGPLGDFERSDVFTLTTWIKPTSRNKMTLLAKFDEPAGRGYSLSFPDAVVQEYLKRGSNLVLRLSHGPDSAIEIRTRKAFILQSWYHLTVVYDGSSRASGLALYVDAERQEVEVIQDQLSGSIRNSEPFYLGKGFNTNSFGGSIDEFRIYGRPLTSEEARQLALYHPVRAILTKAAKERTDKQKEALRDYYQTYEAAPEYREAYAELKKTREEKSHLEKTIPTVMVMQEMEKPRDTFILIRGAYDQPGEKVEPGVPSSLPPLPEGAPRNRLTLAKWLVDPSHPLTARVAVNHFWQMYFGDGLVRTPENFGSQGEPPTHLDLLDWLATEFIRTGWDVKALQRLIVTSATYRQSSQATPEGLEKDPQNGLLARASRFRLPAETIRDMALFVSGLWNGKMGGPSVFPYQPPGLWEVISFGGGYTAQSYTQSHGEDLYRRSMYTFWKRTLPPPAMVISDAPDRETCTARRPRTNTPLQALVLMNETGFVEAARGLAQRMMLEGGGQAENRAVYGFRLVTGRKPAEMELEVMVQTFTSHLAHYRENREEAVKLLSVGESAYEKTLDISELAAWTTVANMILNLDEVITRE